MLNSKRAAAGATGFASIYTYISQHRSSIFFFSLLLVASLVETIITLVETASLMCIPNDVFAPRPKLLPWLVVGVPEQNLCAGSNSDHTKLHLCKKDTHYGHPEQPP